MIFFVAVLFAGMTSLINLYEAPIATVQEKLHVGRKAACLIIAAIGVVVSLMIQGIVSGWIGSPFNLYLPSWRRTCRNYVLLDSW